MSSAINLRTVFVCALAFLLITLHARGGIVITPTEAGYVDGNNDVWIEVDGTYSVTVGVVATGEDSIGTITVLVTGASSGHCDLGVTSEKNLFRIVKDPQSDGRLWLFSCAIDFDIGAPPAATGAALRSTTSRTRSSLVGTSTRTSSSRAISPAAPGLPRSAGSW